MRSFVTRSLVLVAGLTLSLPHVAAQEDLNRFERVVIPVSVGRVPGAHGSLWSTELWYRNNSNRPVKIVPVAQSDYVPTIGITDMLPVFVAQPTSPGLVLYVERDGADDVQFDLRLFNRSDPSAQWGTKIPTVREREFAQVVDLINVPTRTDFRTTLRIYGLPEEGLAGETVHVLIYSRNNQLLASTELALQGKEPLYAQILWLTDAFPEIKRFDRVRIQVESDSGRAKLWAFVSVTSNSTQNVEIVTPD